MEINYFGEKKEDSPQSELLKKVREVKALGDGEPLYRDAEIVIRELNTDEIHPSALYLLKGNMEFVEKMYHDLLKSGIDILDLDQVVESDGYIVGPPLVEVWDGVNIIVDGAHRIALARKLGKKIKTIVVSGVKESRPLFSFPVEWDEVITYEVKPEKAELLRKLRIDNYDTETKLNCFRDLTCLTKMENRRPMSWEKR